MGHALGNSSEHDGVFIKGIHATWKILSKCQEIWGTR